MGQSPGLRPLTLTERVNAWIAGAIPSSFMFFGLKFVTYLLTDPDEALWRYLFGFTPTVNLPLPIGNGEGIEIQLISYLSRSFYVVAYFTWGRNLGHFLADAHVVDRNTMQPMGLGRKLLRSLFLVITAPYFVYIDFLSRFCCICWVCYSSSPQASKPGCRLRANRSILGPGVTRSSSS